MSWLSSVLERNSSDPRNRLSIGDELLSLFDSHHLPSDPRTLNEFCDVLFQWMAASNFKVSLVALEVLNKSLDVSGDVLAPYLLERHTQLVERLGDTKPQVRDAVLQLLLDLAIVPHCSYMLVLEKLSAGFNHKQWQVRVSTMSLFRYFLEDSHEQVETQAFRLVPILCKLTGDPNVEVRETAMNTLVHVMLVYGEDVAVSLKNRRAVPDAKMNLLIQRYEDGLRKTYVPLPRPTRIIRSIEPRPQSVSSVRTSSLHEQENRPGRTLMSRPPSTLKSGTAGAVTENELRKSFTTVPKLSIQSTADVVSQIDLIRAVLEDGNSDWNKRQNSLKLLRSVVINGGTEFEDQLLASMKSLHEGLASAVSDLRSQVCREACTTLCYLAEQLGTKLLPLFEKVFPTCMNLLQSSAKVMASSGSQALEFIVKNVEHPKLVPLVLQTSTHKSKELRKQTQVLVHLILYNWDKMKIDRHIQDIVKVVREGINDADPSARTAARNSFQQLEQHYPNEAQQLYKSLDPSRQKNLNGSNSAASSSQSITSLKDSAHMQKRPGFGGFPRPSPFLTGRSASAIDANVVRRATNTPRQSNLASSRSGIRPNVVRTTKRTEHPSPSLSQPGSRSTSPSRIRRNVPPTNAVGRTNGTPTKKLDIMSTPRRMNGNGHIEGQQNILEAIQRLNLPANDDGDEEDDFLLSVNVRKTEAVDIVTQVIKLCGSANPTEKRDGLKMLQDFFGSGKKFNPADTKKVADLMFRLLAELNHKLANDAIDTLIIFIKTHSALLASHLQGILNRLIQKAANEMLPTSKVLIESALTTIKEQFDAVVLLKTICKIIQESHLQSPTPKTKLKYVTFLYEVLLICQQSTELNNSEFKAAFTRVFAWLDDQRTTAALMPIWSNIVNTAFNLNTSDFTMVLNHLPADKKDMALKELRKSQGNISNSSPMSTRTARSPEAKVSLGGVPRLNNTEVLSEKLDNTNEDFSRGMLEETMYLGSDEDRQKDFVSKLFQEISRIPTEPEKVNEQLEALALLHQMVSEGSFNMWDEHFKPLLLSIFEALEQDDLKMKKMALKLLTKTCLQQAFRLNEWGEMTVTKVLKTLGAITEGGKEKSMYLLSVADECLKVLATHLPVHIVIRTVNPLIQDINSVKTCSALRMLEKLVDGIDQDEFLPLLPEVVPGIIACYKSPESSVRKSTVFCLSAIISKIGKEPMESYMSALTFKETQLVNVYVQRRQVASTNF